MSDMIQPRVLKGFRDFLPEAERLRQNLSALLTQAFSRFGFVPIDTPVLEYAEILLGKSGGETEKQVYHFQDHGKRDVAMRFDLTVPFARFMAEHHHELYLPFKRFHIAKVWRGENTQRGRYREFVQADFDSVGADSASADFEIIALIRHAMVLLGVPDSRIYVNHRGIFNRFLAKAGIADKSVEILRLVDKLAKIGEAETRKQLGDLTSDQSADAIMAFIAGGSSYPETLERVTDLAGGDNPDSIRMRQIWEMAGACGIQDYLVLAPWITRGLDYYTGIVYETLLDAIPDIGSVCSGGRYNDLAGLYTKQHLPGVGASIGLDRLVAALEAIGRLPVYGGGCDAVIFNLEAQSEPDYQRVAQRLRDAGIAAEVFADQRKLAQQYTYAEKKGAKLAILRGADEREKGLWTVRNLGDRTTVTCASIDALLECASSILSPSKPSE